MSVVIRPYQISDQAPVVALWNAVFPDDPPWSAPLDVIERKQSVQAELFLVSECEGRVVGTVLAGFDGVRGRIHHLAVLPAFRRRGLATSLMQAAERGLAELGCPKVNLQVRASNAEVVAFYQGLGYATEERVSLGKPLGRWAAPVESDDP